MPAKGTTAQILFINAIVLPYEKIVYGDNNLQKKNSSVFPEFSKVACVFKESLIREDGASLLLYLHIIVVTNCSILSVQCNWGNDV